MEQPAAGMEGPAPSAAQEHQLSADSPPISADFPTPYTCRLAERVEAGQSLVFCGSVNPDATHFEFSLLCGSPAGDQKEPDIALQICLHFEVGIAVLNTFLDGEWDQEEFHSNPFFHGKPFDLRIRLHEDSFELMACQRHWATFPHRIDFKRIDHIQATGHISLSSVSWGGRYFELPYEMAFHGHALESGQRVFIHGIPQSDFSVGLIGSNKDQLFQLAANFSEQKVLRNAQKNGEWGEEESEGKFPFRAGECFDLSISNEPVSLQISINGDQLPPFFHRADDPHKDYKLVHIEGELELTGVEVSVCWESVGGLAGCCKFPVGKERAAEHVQRMGMSK